MIWYRINRAGWLAIGRWWNVLRTPLAIVLRPWIRPEIDYRADIGPGLAILHPDLGVVVNRDTKVGSFCSFAGGNCVGGRGVILGAHVTMGANSVVLGPVTIGDFVTIAAGAVVMGDFPGPGTLAGVPARPAGGNETAMLKALSNKNSRRPE